MSCHSCGCEYKVDASVPDTVWAAIRPNNSRSEGAGLMCGKCIAEAIENLGGYGSYNIIPDTSIYSMICSSKND